MNIEEIRKEFEKLNDKDYAIFNKKSCPDTSKKIIGIRIPQLRVLAKQIVKTEKWGKMIESYRISDEQKVILKTMKRKD